MLRDIFTFPLLAFSGPGSFWTSYYCPRLYHSLSNREPPGYLCFVSHSADFTLIILRYVAANSQTVSLAVQTFVQTRCEAMYLLYDSVTYGKFTLALLIVGWLWERSHSLWYVCATSPQFVPRGCRRWIEADILKNEYLTTRIYFQKTVQTIWMRKYSARCKI